MDDRDACGRLRLGGWPLDSWSITDPDDGYQAQYIRLLSKFVK
jgi:hypothetical protein